VADGDNTVLAAAPAHVATVATFVLGACHALGRQQQHLAFQFNIRLLFPEIALHTFTDS